MASIKNIKPGMTLYYYDKRKAGNTNMSVECEWPIKVIEVDENSKRIKASFNGSQPAWVSENRYKNYRLKRKKKMSGVV